MFVVLRHDREDQAADEDVWLVRAASCHRAELLLLPELISRFGDDAKCDSHASNVKVTTDRCPICYWPA